MEYDKVIKNISYNQHEILYNIMRLHNNGNGFECDATYSKASMFSTVRYYYLRTDFVQEKSRINNISEIFPVRSGFSIKVKNINQSTMLIF